MPLLLKCVIWCVYDKNVCCLYCALAMFARSEVVTSEWCEHLGVRGAERDELAKKQVQDAIKGEGRSDLNEAELIKKKHELRI